MNNYIFDEIDYENFKIIASMTEAQLFKKVKEILKNIYGKKNVKGKNNLFVAAKGDLPLVLIAHLDTVFKTPPTQIYDVLYDRELGVINSPKGLGADDRAGVFGILKLLSMNMDSRPSILFTTGEEVGGIGAAAASKKSMIELFGCKPKYLVELDRQGYDEAVFYNCDNKEFVEYIESFGFREDWGTFTDISILCPKWGCAGVNLSIGYVNEHSTSELFFPDQWAATLDKVQAMLLEIEDSPYFQYIPRADYFSHFNLPLKMKGHKFCNICDSFSPVITVKNEYGTEIQVCPDCLEDYFDVCPSCHKFKPQYQHLCANCLEEKEDKVRDEVL